MHYSAGVSTNLCVLRRRPLECNCFTVCSSVPKVASGGVPRRPQLDLLSELQQTDSSFPVTGILSTSVSGGASEETEGACSTSDQVSEIANEVADAEVEFGGDYATATSSSQNTVITSTSTLKPANSCHSLASPPSTNEAGKSKFSLFAISPW
ncbi:unnamed protein product [Mesocestoides corti]|uniref:Uncharacterized protein n=1 Tax=Mesocestoides corti TaxID=53468 RepID=A0A0R3U3N7_MESCO|nr:unnamed protein product [Mesocestoides corti]